MRVATNVKTLRRKRMKNLNLRRRLLNKLGFITVAYNYVVNCQCVLDQQVCDDYVCHFERDTAEARIVVGERTTVVLKKYFLFKEVREAERLKWWMTLFPIFSLNYLKYFYGKCPKCGQKYISLWN